MRLATLLTIFVASLALLPSAAGRPADADVSIWLGLGRFGPGGVGRTGDTRTDRSEFIVLAAIDTLVPVEQTVTMTIALPPGLRWGNDGPDPSEGCTGTNQNPAVCTQRLESRGGIIDAGWYWDVAAEQNATYEIVASVQPTEPDPNTANNTTTFRFEVAASASGGGGGGGAAAAAASAARVIPAKPKAGSLVAATVRVSAGGTAIRPTRIACTGTIGAARVAGTPRAASGTASCRYRTPASAKGKTLRGSVAFTARGQRFTKRFSAKLG